MIKKNTVFLNGRKIGTYEFVQKAGSGHINFNGFDPYEANLTDDQQVVLEWLKENGNPNEPFSALDELTGEVFYTEGFKTCIYVAFNNLTGKQQLQLLAAFAEWGLSTLDN